MIVDADPEGYSINTCSCSEGPYIGARKAQTPDCCERCGFMTQEQYEALVAPFIAKSQRLSVILAQASMNANEALSGLATRSHMLKGSLLEIGALVQNTCNGCFMDDHPCGDPVCAVKQEVRAVVLRALMEEEHSGK